MIYKFKSPASGDVIMLAAPGEQFLRLLGREPAAQGIIEVAALPAALTALTLALQAPPDAAADAANASHAGDTAEPVIALRQRLWPMIDMLRRAQAAGQAVVWGV